MRDEIAEIAKSCISFREIVMEDSPHAKSIWFTVEGQSFCIGESEDEQGAEWMKDMFGKAMLCFADQILALPVPGWVVKSCADGKEFDTCPHCVRGNCSNMVSVCGAYSERPATIQEHLDGKAVKG